MELQSAFEERVVEAVRAAKDELVAWVKAYLGGVTIDTEALAVEEIAAVGPGDASGAQVHLAARARLCCAAALLPGLVRRLGRRRRLDTSRVHRAEDQGPARRSRS